LKDHIHAFARGDHILPTSDIAHPGVAVRIVDGLKVEDAYPLARPDQLPSDLVASIPAPPITKQR
jgi:hypothetical protein